MSTIATQTGEAGTAATPAPAFDLEALCQAARDRLAKLIHARTFAASAELALAMHQIERNLEISEYRRKRRVDDVFFRLDCARATISGRAAV